MATRKKTATKKEATKKSGSGSGRGGLLKVGALWLKTGKNGKFMSGTVNFDGDDGNETRILVFKNGYKEEARHPDYVIYVPGEMDGERRGGPITDDDIPF